VLSEKLKGLGNCYKKTNSDIPGNTSFSSQAGIHPNPSADRNSKNEVVQLVPPSRNQLIPQLLSGPRAEKSDHKRSKESGKSSLDRKDEVVPQNGQLVDAKLKIFSFAELKIATSNFGANTVLGEGGFGRVYKGWVNEQTLEPTKPNVGFPVAIKKFNPEGLQGFEEWLAEVNFLGRCIHPNLVKLLGYCYEKKNRELLLVYEFMSKGSLETYIFRRHKELLSWTTRLKIATGAAKGLAFLHSLENPVIYRDFKSSNILLDDHFNPKLSDFGLAKAGPEVEFSHVSTRIMGTYGYAAPEYVATGHLYVKSDVYSFGVVLLEMLTGLRALDVNRTTGQHNLIDYAKPLLKNKRKLRSLVDSRLELNFSLDSAFGLAKLVALCLEVNPKERPSMTEVVEILEQLLQK
jgi:serine/threonine protein kinase